MKQIATTTDGPDDTFCAVLANGHIDCFGKPAKKWFDHYIGIDQVEEVAVGLKQACVRQKSGVVTCWHEATAKQRGCPNDDPEDVGCKPATVEKWKSPDDLGATDIAAGWVYGAATRKGGTYSWSYNVEPNDDALNSIIRGNGPVALEKGAPASVDVGRWASCAVTDEGKALCWGEMIYGFGVSVAGEDRSSASPPTELKGLSDLVDITIGHEHLCALDRAGTVFCWGGNTRLELGKDGVTTGKKEESAKPVKIEGLPKIVAIDAGEAHTLALTDGGDVWCWGLSSQGQCGVDTNDGDDDDPQLGVKPVKVVLPSTAKAVTAGRMGSFAVLTDGRVAHWGASEAIVDESPGPAEKPTIVERTGPTTARR